MALQRRKAIVAALLSAALVSAAGWSNAQDKPAPGKPPAGMQGMQGMEGMGGMMGMMDMMSSCSRRMQGGAMSHGMPHLPQGNAKLELQMHAEMMQRMGEILAKYAAQVKEEKK